MKYYIAADGGGSKLHAILYDEHFHVHRSVRTTGVNALFKPPEVVQDNIQALVTQLLDGVDQEIEAANLCLVGGREITQSVFSAQPRIKKVNFHFEPIVALAAALKSDGVLALSGTGSDAFFIRNGECITSVGGWGPLLGDEGSGYEIGLNAIKAAIYSYDGRKDSSMLLDLVMERWELSDLWGIVGHLAGNPDARHEIASAATLCTKAALAGDRAAIRIYEHAALEMFRQASAVIEPNRHNWDGTVVITGGAWKGYHRMFDIFNQEITLTYPEARVQKPIFEPLVGCAVLGCLQDGYTMADLEIPLKQGFADLLYSE